MHACSMLVMVFMTFPDHRSTGIWTDGDPDGAREFGAHMMLTTRDHDRKLPTFLSLLLFQGFNQHVFHHWFPTVDKSQFYRLDHIIDETVREFGLENLYKE